MEFCKYYNQSSSISRLFLLSVILTISILGPATAFTQRSSSSSIATTGASCRRSRHVLTSTRRIFISSAIQTTSAVAALQTTTTTKMSATGFIGIGIMGEGMAARLLSEGIAGTDSNPLIIWNRTGSKCEALKTKFNDKNVIIKGTAREVVESSNIIYSMLSTPEVSKIVFDGPDGVLAGVSAGKSIIDCATLAEEDMKRMNDAVTSKGGRFLEAPVSGSKAPAANGSLIFLCAGSEELFNEIKDNGLNVMGKASHFFNPEVGYGTRAKLVINSLMGTMVAAYSEGLALSESVGLDPTKMIEVIGQGAIQSPVYALKGPKMIVKDHAPNFPLKHAHKDMALASDMAKNAGVEYSVMDTAEKLFRTAREDNELNVADEDFSAVFEKVHKESTSDFSKKR